jgi:hypothetical protein
VNYSELFLQSWRWSWRTRGIWLLGILASLGSLVATLFRLWLTTTLAGRLPDLQMWLAQPDTLYPWLDPWLARVDSWLIGGLILLFVIFLGIWLVMAIAEGGLIVAVLQLKAGQQPSIGQALQAGRGLLARFVGIDTILFFPLFLLALLAMLLALGTSVGVTILSLNSATTESAMRLLTAASICLTPLLCLLLPASVLTALFRTVAFRDIVIRRAGVRDSIRHAWIVMRRHLGLLLLLFAMLWGMSYLLNLFLGLLGIPLLGLAALPEMLAADANLIASTGMATGIFSVVVAVISILAQAFMHAYASTVWTLASSHLIEESA